MTCFLRNLEDLGQEGGMGLGSHNSTYDHVQLGTEYQPMVWGVSLGHSVGDLGTKGLEILL